MAGRVRLSILLSDAHPQARTDFVRLQGGHFRITSQERCFRV